MSDANNRLPVRHIHNRAVAPVDDDLIFKQTGIVGTRPDSTTIHAADVAIQDSNGNKITPANPLPVVQMSSTPGDGVIDHDELVDIPKDGNDTYTYTVPALKIHQLKQILVHASGKIKVEVRWGTGPLTSANNKAVLFNSVSNPECKFKVDTETDIPAADVIDVVVTNLDKEAFSAYVTLQGVNITNP